MLNTRFLILALGFSCSVALLPAQIVVDGFLDNTGLLSSPNGTSSQFTNPVSGGISGSGRTLSVSASGNFSIVSQVTSSVLIVDGDIVNGGPGSGFAEIEYLGFDINLGTNTFLQFTFGEVLGNPTLGVILGNTNGNGTNQMSGGASLAPSAVGYTVFLDITQFSNYNASFLNGIDDINILIGNSNAEVFVELDFIQFSPVPEPTTAGLAVVSLASLLGLTYRRRGRKALTKSVASKS